MVLKYKVPKELKRVFFNKNVVYCKIIQTEELKGIDNMELHKVAMLNCNGITNIFLNTDLQKLNIWDRLKLIFIK